MPVRWALEEVGQRYEVRLVSFAEMKQPAHRALQPFGQIPTYEEGDVILFETGAMKFGIAICHEGWRYPETVRWAARHGAQIVFQFRQGPQRQPCDMGSAVQHYLDLSAHRVCHHSAMKVSAPAEAIVTS